MVCPRRACSQSRGNSSIITVFLSPLIRRSESSVLLGFVGQGCNQGEVRPSVLLTGLPGESHKDKLAYSLKGVRVPHIAPQLSHYFERL